jgi:Leucine-rich repeat (LRR) protein
LTTLNLHWCDALTGLPESLGRLKMLAKLCLRRCTALAKLPASICQLSELKELDLSNSPITIVLERASVDHTSAGDVLRYMFTLHHPLKILLLVLSARRRRIRHPPAEIWNLVFEEFLQNVQ